MNHDPQRPTEYTPSAFEVMGDVLIVLGTAALIWISMSYASSIDALIIASR